MLRRFSVYSFAVPVKLHLAGPHPRATFLYDECLAIRHLKSKDKFASRQTESTFCSKQVRQSSKLAGFVNMVGQQPEVGHQAHRLAFTVEAPITRVAAVALARGTDNKIRSR